VLGIFGEWDIRVAHMYYLLVVLLLLFRLFCLVHLFVSSRGFLNYSHGMEVGKVKVGRMGNETMGEEVWDLPWHSRALNSADVDRETSTLT
jgi:hypothetical protein